jgi:hypothetical protein
VARGQAQDGEARLHRHHRARGRRRVRREDERSRAQLAEGVAGPAGDPMFAIRSPAYAISRSRRAQ